MSGAIFIQGRVPGLRHHVIQLLLVAALAAPAPDPGTVHGITVSCPTWGWEWGTDAMATTLDAIAAEGANWVAIHPYARILDDGSVVGEPIDPAQPPVWLARPIAEAHARGIAVMIKPHLAYWGSGWDWRGAIRVDDAARKQRFFITYGEWIRSVAAASRSAEAFVVGVELDGTVHHEAEWRQVIASVRAEHPGHLTYAANWDQYGAVPFWDALDAVGVQAYFPVLPEGVSAPPPTGAQLDAGWSSIMGDVRAIHARTGKPVVFTELGYTRRHDAPVTPWRAGDDGPSAEATQIAALRAAVRPMLSKPETGTRCPGPRAAGAAPATS